MSITMTPMELQSLGFDPVASAKLGRAVKFTAGAPVKGLRQPKPWAPYRSKWESAYAAHLDVLQLLGHIVSWQYECETLVCAGGTKYTPDFRVKFTDEREEYHEVKGYFRPQDKVRVREALAVSLLPVVLVSRKGGAWVYKALPARGATPTLAVLTIAAHVGQERAR